MKKTLSIMVAVCILMTMLVSSFTAMAAEESNIFSTDFSQLPAELEQSPSGIAKLVDTDVNYAKALKINSITQAADAEAAIDLGEEYSADKMLVSFDILLNQTTQAVHVVTNNWMGSVTGDKAAYALYFTSDGHIGYSLDGAWHYGNNSCTTPYTAENWIHADMLYNFDKRIITYYINKAVIGSTSLGDTNLAQGKLRAITFNMQSSYNQGLADGNASILVDNVVISKVNQSSFYMTAADKGGYVDVSFSETVKDIEDVNISSLTKVAGNTETTITSVETINPKTVRVNYNGQLDDNCEYRITADGSAESIFGNKLSRNTAYFTTEKGNERVLFSVDGDTNATLPRAFLNSTEQTEIAPYAEFTNLEDEHGKVIALKGSAQGAASIAYTLETPTTGNKIKLSYSLRAAQVNQALSQLANRWFTGCNPTDNNLASAYGIMLNHQHSFAISSNAHHCWSNSGATCKWPNYAANTWYDIDIIYDFTNRTVSTYLGGALVVAGTIHSEILKSNSLKSVSFCVDNGKLPGTNVSTGSNPGSAVFYIDDLKISDISDSPYIRNVRFEDYKGNELMPDTLLPAEINKIKIAFSSEMNEASVEDAISLIGDGFAVPFSGNLDGNVYTMTLTNHALAPEKDYELSLSGAANAGATAFVPDYSFDFSTKEGTFAIESIKILKNGIEATPENLSAGDTVNVEAKIINTSGEAHSAVLSFAAYNGNKMTHFNFVPVEMTANNLYFEDSSLSYTITDITEFNASAFLWDSFGTNRPLTDKVSINK